MGCHTWFSVPILTDKNEIKKLAQEYLNTSKYHSKSEKLMYQYAIDKELVDPCCNLALCTFENFHVTQRKSEEWVIYMDISDYSLMKYNEINNTNIKKYDQQISNLQLESYSDEPRIGGYPEDIVITSYEEMMNFIKKGYDGTKYEGGEEIPHHYDFYYSAERYWNQGKDTHLGVNQEYRDKLHSKIKQFFINHPQGVITFG